MTRLRNGELDFEIFLASSEIFSLEYDDILRDKQCAAQGISWTRRTNPVIRVPNLRLSHPANTDASHLAQPRGQDRRVVLDVADVHELVFQRPHRVPGEAAL